MTEQDQNRVFSLLKQIVAIPSVSGEEALLSQFLQDWLESQGLTVKRKNSNLWCESMINPELPVMSAQFPHGYG